MKQQVAEILNLFEKGAITSAAAITQIEVATGRHIDEHVLHNYWRSQSKDEFIDRLCVEPINNFAQLTDSESLDLISEFLTTKSPGRRDMIDAALVRRYGKPTGTLIELVFQNDLSTPEKILAELKRETRIFL